VDQKRSHLAFPPVGRWVVQREKVMKKPVPSFPRKLKVQDAGDYFRKEVKPKIQLQGKWLLHAGLKPGQQVHVSNPQPGVLVVKCLD
jgi:multidrug efflux pump subunit AcrA (membrane-fusion protein)